MDPGNAIEVRGLSKSFVLERKTGEKGAFGKEKTEKVRRTALEGIDLDIRKGDVVGIVGRNGSGKSTLLKIISHIMEPDEGTVSIDGKIASILELGMGFHPDMTGRENIYLKGELYGFSRGALDERIDSIIAYSGVGEYIDSPVRTYSTGMTGRLAFAVMVNIDADILLVDEVLSTGDVVFAAKAREHFRKLSKSGKTVIFVSHSLGTIEDMCTRGVWIDSGRIMKDGRIKDITSAYMRGVEDSPEIVSDLAEYEVPDAQHRLSLMYRDGRGVEKDEAKREEWLKKSAEQGYVPAQAEYAELLYARGDEASKAEALEFYRSAALSGNEEAKARLSAILGGYRADRDADALRAFYRRLADRGNPLDEFRCGDLMLTSARGEDDRREALVWFNKAAERGNCDAMFKVGEMLRDGKGEKKDPKKAVEWFERAAAKGHVRSQFYLGEVYYHGRTVPRDEAKALKWY